MPLQLKPDFKTVIKTKKICGKLTNALNSLDLTWNAASLKRESGCQCCRWGWSITQSEGSANRFTSGAGLTDKQDFKAGSKGEILTQRKVCIQSCPTQSSAKPPCLSEGPGLSWELKSNYCWIIKRTRISGHIRAERVLPKKKKKKRLVLIKKLENKDKHIFYKLNLQSFGS